VHGFRRRTTNCVLKLPIDAACSNVPRFPCYQLTVSLHNSRSTQTNEISHDLSSRLIHFSHVGASVITLYSGRLWAARAAGPDGVNAETRRWSAPKERRERLPYRKAICESIASISRFVQFRKSAATMDASGPSATAAESSGTNFGHDEVCGHNPS
jgi:hypothetical protein